MILIVRIALLLCCSTLFSEEGSLSQPVSIYLSWQEDPSTTMIVKWISSSEDSQTCLHYKPVTGGSWQKEQGETVAFPNNEPYVLHTVHLKSLAPKTMYSFHIEGYEAAHLFETAPELLKEPLSFIIGGDINLSNPALFQETTRKAAELNPAFIVMGGDLACAVVKKNKSENPDKWLQLLKLWYETAQYQNRLIPLLPVIGNHDIQGSYDKSLEKAPYFSLLFLDGRKTSFSVLRFDTYASLYFLDSGHAASPGGEQKEWLSKELAQDKHMLHRIAIYHVSAYPPVRPYRNAHSSSVRSAWIPLFDTFHLHLAFEHHDHAYKRTYPLKGNEPDPQGVVYVGNGSWGVKPRVPKKASQTLFLEKTCQMRGFCEVRLSTKSRDVFAISFDGKVIDSFSQLTDKVALQQAFEKDFTLWKKSRALK